MPKVVIANTRLESTGGIETYASDVAQAFVSLGWEVTALNVRDVWRGERYGFTWYGLMPKGYLAYRLAIRFKEFLTQRWLSRNLAEYDLVICTHRVVAPSVKVVCERMKRPYVVVLHGLEVWQDLPQREVAALESASKLIHVSAFTKAEVLSRFSSLEADSFSKISPCVDVGRFEIAENVSRNESVFKLLTVGRLDSVDRDKGHRLVMKALSVLKQNGIESLHYKIVGDGPDRGRLEAFCAELNLEDEVEFLGRVSDEEKVRAYHECDLFLLVAPLQRLSEGRLSGEGFGIVYLEAGACAKPVIGGDEGGSVDPVRNGENGYRCSQDEKELAALIEKLLRNRPLLERLSEQSYKLILNEYSVEVFREKWQVIAEDLLNSYE